MLFYAPVLFQTLGTSQNYSLLSAVIQGCAKVFGALHPPLSWFCPALARAHCRRTAAPGTPA